MSTLQTAFAIAFQPKYAYATTVAGALGMLALLVWSGGLLVYYPSAGWDVYASPLELFTVIVLSALFGVLLTLEVAAVAKARSAAATSSGILGSLFGILSMSCCAPLIAPALLSFIGFSGMTVLQVNITVHEWTTQLTIASIALMLLSIGLVSRTITAACRLDFRPR